MASLRTDPRSCLPKAHRKPELDFGVPPPEGPRPHCPRQGDLARHGAGACPSDTRDSDARSPGEQATQIPVSNLKIFKFALLRSPPRSSSGTVASLEARLASKEADIDVLKAQVQSLNMALEESRQQASTGVAASLEALEPRTLAASELAALRAALPRAVSAVETEVSRRLVAAEATRSDAQEVREDEALCVCCLDRPRDIVFLSCMHVVVCEQCATRTASCPTCRVPITEKRRIFR